MLQSLTVFPSQVKNRIIKLLLVLLSHYVAWLKITKKSAEIFQCHKVYHGRVWRWVEYKHLFQYIWICHRLYWKKHKVLHQWLLFDSKHLRGLSSNSRSRSLSSAFNLCHLLRALALIVSQCFSSHVYEQEKSHVKYPHYIFLAKCFSLHLYHTMKYIARIW